MDWLKVAKELQQKADSRKLSQQAEQQKRSAELHEAEANWMDRVGNRVQEINQSGFTVHVRKKDNQMELSLKGKVRIDFKGHQLFEIIYHDVVAPSMLVLRNAVTVHHHRLVQVRQLDPANIEEILKFVVLGMQEYCKMAKHSRVERNLQHIQAVNRLDEHI